MVTMKIAVAYMRMSTDKQEHSIESQQRLIKKFAHSNGYRIKHYYIDEGISGRNAEKRPAFMEMIEDSTKKEFECVLIYDSSRFARNLEQSLVYKSLLKKNDVQLLSITEPILDDDTSLITDALFGAMNEMYSRKLSKNVKRGMEQKALRGEFAAPAPFGYDYDKKKGTIVINEKEAPIVKYLFQEAHAGRSAYSLSKEMRDKNIKTKLGGTLERRRIDYILRNPAYIGYLRWGYGEKEILRKSNHEALIEEKLFEEVQKLLYERTLKQQRHRNPPELCKHWLSGTMRCSECQCTYVFAHGYQGRKDRFRCSGQSRGRCSSASSFTLVEISNKVINILKEIITTRNAPYHLPVSHQKGPSVDYEKDSKRLKQTLQRAKNSYLIGIDTLDEYGENKKKILAEMKKLEVLKKEEHSKKSDERNAGIQVINSIKILEGHEYDQKKQMLFLAIVEKIMIDKQNKNIQLFFYD